MHYFRKQSHTNKQTLIQRLFLDAWYNQRWWVISLLPLSWIYQLLHACYYFYQKKYAIPLVVPIVIIGNISIGGTGKTPVVIALANKLKKNGLSVGIISRGYGSQAPYYPYQVSRNNDVDTVGDEPILIIQSTHCPVVIDKDRVAAAQYLITRHPDIDVLLSDDGLQHYHLERMIEVIVIDEKRGLGNNFCLPAGPLRESDKRLASVDWILINHTEEKTPRTELGKIEKQQHIILKPTAWRHLASKKIYPLYPFPWLRGKTMKDETKADSSLNHIPIKPLIAIAGIGNPSRFFKTLASLGLKCDNYYAYNDHYSFSINDFSDWQKNIVLMTEKDAVKCQSLIHQECWSLQVTAQLPDVFVHEIINSIKDKKK